MPNDHLPFCSKHITAPETTAARGIRSKPEKMMIRGLVRLQMHQSAVKITDEMFDRGAQVPLASNTTPAMVESAQEWFAGCIFSPQELLCWSVVIVGRAVR